MKKVFLSEFIKETKTVGSITPSSKFLMKKMLSKIDFSKDVFLIELGPGTGVFTTEILSRMTKNSKLLSFEINPIFHNQLTSKFKDERLTLICDSAENVKKYIPNDVTTVDGVISSLPLAVIPIRVKLRILNSIIEVLKSNCYFIQFQYSMNAKKILKSRFKDLEIDFTPLNIPPAFVYYCRN
jgi:phosphatidylethanolamine/phosphatidyl-N-methylethanolamine N-methyltransferase